MNKNPHSTYYKLSENYGYWLEKIPQNVFNELEQQINNLQSDFNKGIKYNHNLVGEIEHEYQILPQFQTKQYIKDLSQRFESEAQYMVTNYNPIPILRFDNLWVNFQKKHEYNPIHQHEGILSFVIFYQIPYTFEDEKKYNYNPSPKHMPPHGKFGFIIPTPFHKKYNLKTHYLSMDKLNQGCIAIFPSDLHHVVYPFYSSDEYRITIAGNVIEGE